MKCKGYIDESYREVDVVITFIELWIILFYEEEVVRL